MFFCRMPSRRPHSRPSRASSRKPLNKAMLLPMPETAAREISLVNHLTFVACRSGSGSAYLFNELIRMIYLAYYIQDAGFGDTDLIIYACAEAAMERVLQRAEHARAWTLDANDIPLFEAVLRQSDRQLANAPRHVHLGARHRLDCFAASNRTSPLRAAATSHSAGH